MKSNVCLFASLLCSECGDLCKVGVDEFETENLVCATGSADLADTSERPKWLESLFGKDEGKAH